MPARFILPNESLGERLRNNPLALGGVAAAGGLLCGGLIVAMLSGPSTSSAPANRAQAVETTGSAPQRMATEPRQEAKARNSQGEAKIQTSGLSQGSAARSSVPVSGGDNVAAVDCQEQTWPYIARPCLANETQKRGVRVISTDRLAEPVIGALEAPPAEVTNRFERRETEQQPLPPPPAMMGAPATPSATAAKRQEPPAAPATGSIVASAAIQPAFHTESPAPPPELATPQRRKAADVERPSRKRKAARQRAPRLDDEVGETGRSQASERPRVVERWIERDYDVPSASRNGSRSRVTVIQRGEENYRSAPGRRRSAADSYYARYTDTSD